MNAYVQGAAGEPLRPLPLVSVRDDAALSFGFVQVAKVWRAFYLFRLQQNRADICRPTFGTKRTRCRTIPRTRATTRR